jgi:LuxR family transcriptional regulator, maltose regulon positive regulatory protein
MSKAQINTTYLGKLSVAEISAAGGWRLFMRHAGDQPSGMGELINDETAALWPHAALGVMFAEAKRGEIVKARKDFQRWRGVFDGLAISDPQLAVDIELVDMHLSVYEDRSFSLSDLDHIRHVRQQVPETDHIGRGLACNHLCNIALQMGDFDLAQKYAEQAIRAYLDGEADFGAMHLHTHLAQIRLMRGDLDGAGEILRSMEAKLGRLPGQAEWLISVARILRAEVAYEANDLEQASLLFRTAFSHVEHKDAWFDILTAAYRVSTRLAFADFGLPGAMEALSHAERIAQERSMPRLLRLMKIERVRALTLSDELRAATRLLGDIELSTDRSQLEESQDLAFRQGTTFVAVARLMVRNRRAQDALAFIAPAEDLAIRRGQLLSLAKLRVIAATAHWQLGNRVEATSSLLSAIRLLGEQPFYRFILDEGPQMQFIVQAALDGDYVSVQPTRSQRRRLSEMMQYWITQGRVGPGHYKSDVEDLHRRYVELLALGHANKEIARIMGVSINTVKYHLKQMFRELDADNRSRAVQRARDLGWLET